MFRLKQEPQKSGKNPRYLRLSLILLVLALIVLLPSFVYAASVTKNNSTDGAADGSEITRTVDITAGDFSANASISSVTATVQFAKINAPEAASCFSIGHQGGDPVNREIYMYLTSPGLTRVDLIYNAPNFTYTENSVYGGTVTVTFDDFAATSVGGPAPTSGTFRPEEPLAAFFGEDPLGTWTLTVGDGGASDPLCFYDFSLTVVAEQSPVVDDQTFSVAEDSPVDTVVDTIVATDGDPNEKLLYTVTGGSGQNVFDVDVLTGEITVADPDLITTPGSFELNVTVTDSAALTDTAIITINVTSQNDAPVIGESDPASVTMDEDGSPTAFSLQLTATDEENDTLTWSIDTQATNGTASASGTGSPKDINYTPDVDYYGTDSFVVQVSDGNGGTDTITVNVTINSQNDNPDAVNDSFDVNEDSSSNSLDVLFNDDDAPDSGETLTITAVGTTNNGGTATNNTTDITYTPVANFSGTETFTYTISDGNGGTDTATVTVTVNGENDPPVITEGASTSVNMDEDSAPTAFSLTLNATDPENDTITWTVLTQASHGTASASGTGTSKSIGYTPTANYSGSDSFVVQVSDGNGGTDTITVNVTLAAQADAPDAVDDGYTVDENSSGNTLLVLQNDSDPDAGATFSITAVDNPTTQNGATTNNTTSISYTPPAGFVGTDTFTYTIEDNTTLTDTATVTITVRNVNEAPVITQGATLNAGTMDEDGSPTAFTPFLLDATDGDGDNLTWSIQTQGLIGTAVITGTNPANTMGFNYTPTANMNGSDSFVVRVSDGNGGTDDITVSVTINEVNDNPDAVDDAPSVNEGSSNNTLSPLANDTFYPDTGETLSISSVGAADNGGTVVNNGTNLTYTPAATFVGTETFTYTISDGRSGSDTATIRVSVDNVNFPPVISEGTSTSVTMDEDGSPTAFSLTLHATDPDADTLTWSLQSQASHGVAIVTGTGTSKTVSYTPAAHYFGSDSFIVRVNDGHGGLDSITVNVTINPINDAPDAVDDSRATPPETAVVITVLDNDTDPENDTLTVTAVTQGSKGSVTHNGTTVTYTPNANQTGSDNFTYTISDGHGGSDTATVTVQLGLYKLFIPLVLNNFVSAPDLIVTNISASSTLVEVTIENQGTMATSSGFWVDFYIDPDPVPMHENEVWSDVSDEGIVWGVNVSIAAGDSLTLRYSTAPGAPNLFYSEENSGYTGLLPVGTTVYAQVDSAHLNTTYGGVLELHEILGTAYNNVSAAYTAVAPTAPASTPALSQLGEAQLDLPLRPEAN